MHNSPKSNKDIFTEVYAQGLWGKSDDAGEAFFSGEGSHDPALLNAYVQVVATFLGLFGSKLDAVDLGCGDFHVGSKLRPLCQKYVACDVVAELIERNRRTYQDLDVDFRVVDAVQDELPEGDVIFIRQVLQHLSNAQIENIVQRLPGRYRAVVVSEHLPWHDFTANLDKPTGSTIRVGHPDGASGVVLTEPPFNLSVRQDIRLLEFFGYGGVIRTNAYLLG